MANSVYDDKVPGEHELADNSNIPLGDPSDPRGHDTTPANKASDPRGDLQNAEQNSGMFNPHDDGGSSGGRLNPKALAAAEVGSAVAAGGVAGGIKKGLKQFMGSKKGRRSAIGGGVITLAVTVVIAILGIASGPLQLVHLSEILQKNFSGENDATASRTNGLFRFAKSGNFGETRVRWMGSNIFGETIDQLKDVGVEFPTNSLDQIKAMEIDPSKLSKTYPKLDGMSPAEQKAFIADTFNVPTGDISHSGGKFSIDTRNYGIKASRGLVKNANAALEDGKVISGLKFRSMAKFFDLPSLFHPIKRIQANASKKAVTAVEAKSAEADRQAALEEPTLAKAKPAEDNLKSTFKGPQAIAGGALLLTGGMCLVRSVADDVVKVNQAAIVAPAAIKATDAIALGAQIKAGQDITAEQVGAAVDSLTDSNGKTIWQSQPLQVTAGTKNPSGQDISYDYKQAFTGKTTAAGIKNTIGGGAFGSVSCSTPGLIIQGLAGVVGGVVAIFTAIPSGGASIALETGRVAAGIAATAGGVYLIEHQLTHLLADKAIIPAVTQGPVGGTILAYGTRAVAGMGARSSGGVALNNTQTTVLDKQAEAEDQKSFQSKSYFAKVFDAKDYRSVTGQLTDSISPSMSQNVASLVGGFTHLGSLIPDAFSALLPKAHAYDKPYDWGFPEYGIPQDMLNDPALEDPYNNADKVASILDAGDPSDYVSRAKSCFGVDISKGDNGWDVDYNNQVNPDDQDYIDAHCNDTSDTDWKRIMLFVFDTKTMDAISCYHGGEGADQSCQEIGIGGGSSTTDSGAGGGTTSTAGATIDIATLTQDSTSIACAANTKDLGTQDGYSGGNKVKIRICAVSNLPSTGEESNGGFGVSGANGKAVVNSRVSGAVYAMVAAAQSDGVTLTAASSFRTMSHQQALCSQNALCSGGTYTRVAKPGTSNHQMGLAIDFSALPATAGPVPGNQVWTWLNANASNFGYRNYPVEAWHWSPTGN